MHIEFLARVCLWAAVAVLVTACGTSEPAGSDADATTSSSSSATEVTSSPATSTVESPSAQTEVPTPAAALAFEIETFEVPAGARPHDVAPAADGGVWYTAQGQGALGYLDPSSGEVTQVALGAGSAPHGVIVGDEGVAWVTDGGLNAIVRVAPDTREVTVYPLPADRPGANLNTATFDGRGRLWFTGQAGVVGVFDPATEEMTVFDAPRGRGPYGIASAPDGTVWLASLAGSYLGRIDLDDLGTIEVIEPPTSNAGVRRVWSDSSGRLWISQWNAGQVGVYDPATESWNEWPLPDDGAQAYAVYVDELDAVWLTDFGSNSLVRFDPATEEFQSFPLPGQPGNVRQLLGRDGEVWAPESASDTLVVIRYGPDSDN